MKTRRHGMTLIELLVVLMIISIIAGMVIAVRIKLRPPAGTMEIALIRDALERYRDDFGSYPPDTGYGLKMDAGSPHYDPGSLWRYLHKARVHPRTKTMMEPYLPDWPQSRMEPYKDPLRGDSKYLVCPLDNVIGYVADRGRTLHNVDSFDLFTAGKDRTTACDDDPQDPDDTSPDANKAYNGKDDDGNGVVDDRGEFGPKAVFNGDEDDDVNNWSR